ncbi:MAG: dephospho-CoA kinase [Variovorax sp.]
MLRIGLTGGIGSGKSTVAQMLAAHGCVLVDTDAISHQLTGAGGAAMTPIEAAFGAHVVDAHGALDRGRMREQVFADASARKQLESILHPLIGDECIRLAARAFERDNVACVVFDVPLLVESQHWRRRVDRVLVVDAKPQTQCQRVAARPGWTEAGARAVMAQQTSRSARRAAADDVIFNDALPLAELARQVARVYTHWMSPAKG